jgi:hypothetical protein
MEPNTSIVQKAPADLRLHRLQANIPAPDRDSTEWVAFVDSIQNGGILQPLIITPDGQIMDGGWRWRAAKQLDLLEVPCLIRSESEAAVIITESLLHRKQMTRGAAVYLALSLVSDFVASAETRRLNNLKRGNKTREIPLFSPKSSNCSSEENRVVNLCERWGIAAETYNRARQVREIFEASPEIKEEWEPKLLSGEKNLWNILSAVGGAGADQTGRDEVVARKQLEFWTSAFKPLCQRVSFWKKLNGERRDAVLQQWRTDAAELPPDLRHAMVGVLLEAK